MPICLVGEPGIGKSSIIESVAAENDLNCLTLTASDRDPTDFSGLPFPDKEHTRVTRLVEDWMHTMLGWDRGVLFMDELTTLNAQLQAVLLRGMRDGVWAGREAPKGVRFISAMNPTSTASGGHKITIPLANRFCWVDFPMPTPEEWGNFMMRSQGGLGNTKPLLKASKEEKRVMKLWDEEYAKAIGFMCSAVRKFPDCLFNKPKNNDPQSSAAWPSHRTMEYATRSIASSVIHDLSQADADEFMAGFIGEPAAMKVISLRTSQDIPDVVRLLEGKEKFKHNSKRLDCTWAVLSACTALVVPENCKNRKKRVEVMWGVLSEVADTATDLVSGPCKALVDAQLHIGSKEALRVLSKIAPLLDAAGIAWRATK